MTYGPSIVHPWTPIDRHRTGCFEGVGSQTVSHVVGNVPLLQAARFLNFKLTVLADVALAVSGVVR